MYVASGGIAGSPLQGNDFPTLHVLSNSYEQLRIMAVSGMYVLSVIKGDPQARVAGPACEDPLTGSLA